MEDQSHWIAKFQDILMKADLDGQPNDLIICKFSESAKQKIALLDDNQRPDVAILDARVNGSDQAGFSVSSALNKKWPDLPIIFLSEHSGTDIEKDAFGSFHAVDFIAKHQKNIEEVLCWRIRAVIRQSILKTGDTSNIQKSVLTSGGLRIDLDTWEVYWNGIKLMNPVNSRRPLAPTPRKILRCLVERSPRPVSTFDVADYLEVDPEKYSQATYRQHIKTLRKAFDMAQGGDGSFLESCKQGYGIVTFGDQGAYLWKKPQD